MICLGGFRGKPTHSRWMAHIKNPRAAVFNLDAPPQPPTRSLSPNRLEMIFAALTPDQETRYLIEAAIRYGDSVAQIFGPPSDKLGNQGARRSQFPTILFQPLDAWEQLLHDPLSEAVFVGHDLGTDLSTGKENRGEAAAGLPPADHSERLKRLAQAAVPLVAGFPACDTLDGFQLQMIQQDTRGVIVPYFPGLYSPLAAYIRDWGRNPENNRLGALQQISVQRFSQATSHEQMLLAFARDATLIRRSFGKIERISALRPLPSGSADANDWSGVSVQMSDANGRVAQWTLWRDSPRGDPNQVAEFFFQGSHGRMVAECRKDRPFHLIATSFPSDKEPPDDIPADRIPGNPVSLESLDDLEFAAVRARLADPSLALEEWDNACRSMELADAIATSVRRGKTIQLFHEEHSELSTFKSVMAAGGCLSLLAILGLIPLLVVMDRVVPGLADHPNLRRLPWIALALILLVFLAFQGIIKLTGTGKTESPS
jgi:hypothetical protein